MALADQTEEKRESMSGKILLMDDEEIVLKVASKIITKLGYEIEISRDGDEAVRLYREAMDSGKPFKAVVMDLTIPGGMGGGDAIKILKNMDPNVKAFVSSGYSSDPLMVNHKDYGFAGVITKPYKVEEIKEVLDREVG